MSSSPPQRTLWPLATALHLGLALWVFHACLQPGLFPYGRDTVSHDILFFDHGWSTVRGTGLIPLWNHHLFAGWPWVAAAGWTPWYPPHWIALIAPVAFAFTLQYVLHHAWAGLGFTLWGRALGLGFGPALLGGVLFQMSGHFTTLVFPGHLSKFEAIAWMPWVMGLFLMSLNRRSGRVAVWAALCLAMQILTQHAQIVYYTVGLIVALALWKLIRGSRVERRGWMAPDEPAYARRSLRSLRYLIGVGLLAGSLALVQLLPATEMIRISNRAEGVSWEEAVQTSYPPEELVELVWPGLFGSSVDGTYHGAWGERLVSDYLGMVTVLGALYITLLALVTTFTFIMSPGFRSLSPWLFQPATRMLALVFLFILTLLLALGDHTPLYRLLYDWLPGWDRWRSPATIMCVSTFAACTLAAMGWSGVLIQASAKRRAVGVGMVAALIALAVVDQARVVRQYVEPVGLPFDEVIARGLSGQRARPDWYRTPQQQIYGRKFMFGSELNNFSLYSRRPSVTGYHPIVLLRYERLLQTRGYDDLIIHRLLGVASWITPADSPVPLQLSQIVAREVNPSYINRSREIWDSHSGGLSWGPRSVRSAESSSEAFLALRDLSENDDPYDQVVIVGLVDLPEDDHSETLLGSLLLRTASEYEQAHASRTSLPQFPPWMEAREPVLRGILCPGLNASINRLAVPLLMAPREARWIVISQILAPGWHVFTTERVDLAMDDFLAHRAEMGGDSIPVDVRCAWGALWAFQMQGNETLLLAEYRPASVRLGLFVTLAALAVVLALGGRLPKTDPQS